MAMPSVEECRELMPILKDVSDEEVIKIRNNLHALIAMLLEDMFKNPEKWRKLSKNLQNLKPQKTTL